MIGLLTVLWNKWFHSFSIEAGSVSTVLQLIGSALIVTGVAFIYPPAGIIVAGVLAILIGLAVRK